MTREVFPQHAAANRTVSRVRRDVDRDDLLLEPCEQRRQIRAATVLPDNDRRDALADHRERVARSIEAAIMMAVRVDKPWRQRLTGGVERPLARLRRQLSDGDDAIASDADVAATSRFAAAIDQQGAANQRGRCRRRRLLRQ
jgi:hypothetical protein